MSYFVHFNHSFLIIWNYHTFKESLFKTLRTTFTLAVILTTASALQGSSVHQLAKWFVACSEPTAVSHNIDSPPGAPDVVTHHSSASGGYLDSLPHKTFSTPAIPVVPTPTKSSGTGFGSYLNGLPRNFFTTPVVTIQAAPAIATSSFGNYLDRLRGKYSPLLLSWLLLSQRFLLVLALKACFIVFQERPLPLLYVPRVPQYYLAKECKETLVVCLERHSTLLSSQLLHLQLPTLLLNPELDLEAILMVCK